MWDISHRQNHTAVHQGKTRQHLVLLAILLCGLCFASALSGCDNGDAGQQTLTTGNKSITYSTKTQDVLIRTFYGGGLYGSFSLGPQVSVYGDGSYILGLEQQGKLSSDALQKLLSDLVDTYGLLNLQRQHFSDMPDQNATYLELYLNGKQFEFAYGTFGSQPQSKQDLDEYARLGKAITEINETLTGELHPYSTNNYALLVRQNFNPGTDPNQILPAPDLPDFTLARAAEYICGKIPPDNPGSPNQENGCLKYTVPQNALLLNATQLQAFKAELNDKREGTFQENGNYYTVVLRPLLPDEPEQKKLAMFGSSQSTYKDKAVPLHEGALP